MNNRLRLMAFLAPLLLGLPACDHGGSADQIVVGEYGSLTGTTATFGQSTHNGIMLAVEELNGGSGLLGGKKVKVLTEDDQSKPEEAATAATKLINQDRVVALLGEVASSRSLAAAPISQAAKVPMISPSSTNAKVTQVGNYIFRVCFIDEFQGLVMAKFAAHSLKVKKAAVLKDVKTDYSAAPRQVSSEESSKPGGTIVGEQSYSEGHSDFRAQRTQLKSLS